MKRLAQTPDKVVSAEELCGFAGIQCSPSHQNLHNELWRLRARLGREMATSIVNVRGRGYRLAAIGNSKSLCK
jgi:DNA-binding response OmpR family regulator